MACSGKFQVTSTGNSTSVSGAIKEADQLGQETAGEICKKQDNCTGNTHCKAEPKEPPTAVKVEKVIHTDKPPGVVVVFVVEVTRDYECKCKPPEDKKQGE